MKKFVVFCLVTLLFCSFLVAGPVDPDNETDAVLPINMVTITDLSYIIE